METAESKLHIAVPPHPALVMMGLSGQVAGGGTQILSPSFVRHPRESQGFVQHILPVLQASMTTPTPQPCLSLLLWGLKNHQVCPGHGSEEGPLTTAGLEAKNSQPPCNLLNTRVCRRGTKATMEERRGRGGPGLSRRSASPRPKHTAMYLTEMDLSLSLMVRDHLLGRALYRSHDVVPGAACVPGTCCSCHLRLRREHSIGSVTFNTNHLC